MMAPWVFEVQVNADDNPSPNLDEGGNDYPNPMMRVMVVLVLGRC